MTYTKQNLDSLLQNRRVPLSTSFNGVVPF